MKWDILEEILPNEISAHNAMFELMLLGRENALIDEEEVIVPKSVQKEENMKEEEEREVLKSRFDLRLSKEEEKRLRFRGWNYSVKKIPNTRVEFVKFGPRWGRGLSLAWETLRNKYKPEIFKIFDSMKIWDQQTEKGLRGTLKMLSDVAKKHGELLFPGYWEDLVNWENLGGYLEIPEMSTFVPDIEEWVLGDIMHEMPNPQTKQLDEGYFLDTLEQGMMEFMERAPSIEAGVRSAMTIDDYASRPGLWMSGGSSMSNITAHNAAVYAKDQGGKFKKAGKTKARTGLALSKEQIIDILTTKDPTDLAQFNVAIPKAEAGKVRAVVNSALEMFLRMDFVSQFLEKALAKHPDTTLYYDEKMMFDMWTKMGMDASDPDTIKIPLDQSHFDWQQNMRMIERFCIVITNFISRHMPAGEERRDLLLVMDSISQGLYKLPGIVEIDGQKLVVGKGVLSGWRWTALIDTVFNIGEFYCAERLISDFAPHLPSGVTELIGQGDDDKVLTTSAGYAAALTVAYLIMNFEINPGKFFIDNARDEYLRQISSPGLVRGYVVRGINTILWRNPGSSDPPRGLMRASDQMKSWNKLVARGGNKRRIEELMIQDIMGGNALSRDDVLDLLSTPTTVGGLGYSLGTPRDRWLSFKPGEVKYNTEIKKAGLKGIETELGVWATKYGRTFTEREKTEALIDRLDVSTFAEREVVEGVATETPMRKMSAMNWELSYLTHPTEHPPMAAYAREGWPDLFGDFVLKEELQGDNAFEFVQNKWIALELQDVSERIYKRGKKRVWIDWVNGKLPFKAPVVPGWREEAVSLCYKNVVGHFWARLLRRMTFNKNDIYSIALLAESVVYHNISSLPVRIAG